MATAISVTCPGCKKAMRAPIEARGKKVRCKSCNHVFVVPAAPARAPAGKPGARPQPGADAVTAMVPPPEEIEDDDGESKPYGVLTMDLTPRCPHCANELESAEAVICLKCGYNLQTRDFHRTRTTLDVTGGDVFVWLLPGILCVILVLCLIGFDIWYCLKIKSIVAGEDWLEWLGSGFMRLWMVIFTLFIMYKAGKFAFIRLILNPTPPEIEV
jgi:hypothetical protein